MLIVSRSNLWSWHDEAKAPSLHPPLPAYLHRQLPTVATNTQQDAFSVRAADYIKHILYRILQ